MTLKKYVENEKVKEICDSKNALCTNTYGSYECVCEQGFAMYNYSCHGKFFKIL